MSIERHIRHLKLYDFLWLDDVHSNFGQFLSADPGQHAVLREIDRLIYFYWEFYIRFLLDFNAIFVVPSRISATTSPNKYLFSYPKIPLAARTVLTGVFQKPFSTEFHLQIEHLNNF